MATEAPPPPVDVAEIDPKLEDEEDFDDIFDESHSADGDWQPDPIDSTKAYNRQLHDVNSQNSPHGTAVNRTNPNKPSANTFASVDDQIAALSKHAAKIRLDDVKQDAERDKDKADRATSDQVLDNRTRMILLQMINRGVVSEIHGAISTGKEANVYGAVSQPDGSASPAQRAIKVYKTAILQFKDRERYITGEHRFKSGSEKGNSRKMVKLWAEKEFRNLKRIHAAGIPCPEPVDLKLHVMVMGFLGDRRGFAYPRLRDATLTGPDLGEQWRDLYVQLLGYMRRLYQVCKLVHADLSEYNILYNDKTLYIIDVSQSVEPDHPRSLEFLRMDIKNTGAFFRRQGVETLTDRAVFNFTTVADGPVGEPGLSDTIEKLYEAQARAEGNEETLAALEVDNEVFRNQYIPQTLDQVYDIEKDAQKMEAGEDLVYKNLLAEQIVLGDAKEKDEADEDSDGFDEGSDSGADLGSGEEDEGRFDKGPPRGRRFQDKDEKKQHKQAVKEEKREKRKDKMPKHLKKQIIAKTTKKKR